MTRTGVFLCTCDREIDKSIDVGAMVEGLSARRDGTLQLVERADHLCLPNGLAALEQAIRTYDLGAVVIAACPERFQGKRLQRACARAKADAPQLALVDWREGCAWPHRQDRENATAQARDLVEMALARVAEAAPAGEVTARISPGALVLGGGIAGMAAARALADRGVRVTLIERNEHLGGQLYKVPLDGYQPAYDSTVQAVSSHPNIHLRLNSTMTSVEGAAGDYHVTIEAPPDNRTTVDVGAIVVATGAREYSAVGLYRHDGRRVVTLAEFEAELGFDSSPWSPSASVCYILCAGSRDDHVPYCSKVCCLASVNQALRFKSAHPSSKVSILYRDLYLLGDELNEERVRQARREGIEFIRYALAEPPHVEDETVTVREASTRARHEIPAERIVLAVPLVPRPDAGGLARSLNLTRDQAGFFTEPHLRVRPEDQPRRGVFLCGAAHHPVDPDTALLQGLAAGARAAKLIARGELTRPARGASVNPELCTGCAQCFDACSVGAVRMTSSAERESVLSRAVIDPLLCLGCGNCVVACPSKAIELPQQSDRQILAQIRAALPETGEGRPRLLVLACTWSGFAAMELAGARGMAYAPHVRTIELPCSARLDPLHVLYALMQGAERVVVALCPPGECHFGNGNHAAEERIERLRKQLAAYGIDPERVSLVRLRGDDAPAWVRAVEHASVGL